MSSKAQLELVFNLLNSTNHSTSSYHNVISVSLPKLPLALLIQKLYPLIPARKVSAPSVSPQSLILDYEWPQPSQVFAFNASNLYTAFYDDAVSVPLSLLPILARHEPLRRIAGK
jgi:hypothetical protein